MQLTDAARLGRTLLDQHGLDDWELVFDRAKQRAGICRPDRKQVGLSGLLTQLHPESEVRDTILHEIAHALVGPKHGHDATWQATARRIGCSGLRCASPDAPMIDGDWVGTCSAGHRMTRHRRPERPASCGRCSSTFDARHLFTWHYRGRTVAMGAGYEAHLARLQGDAVETVAPLRLGERMRIVARGQHHGVVGTLVKRGRTRVHLRVDDGVLTVPFALAERIDEQA